MLLNLDDRRAVIDSVNRNELMGDGDDDRDRTQMKNDGRDEESDLCHVIGDERAQADRCDEVQ